MVGNQAESGDYAAVDGAGTKAAAYNENSEFVGVETKRARAS